MSQFKYKYYTYPVSDEHNNFVTSLQYYSILQDPEWLRIIYPERKICLFYLYEEETIIAYAAAVEKYGFAKIHFGPLTNDSTKIVDLLVLISNYYKKNKLIHFECQLGFIDEENKEFCLNQLNPYFNLCKKTDVKNWATIVIDLNNSIENIFKEFSDNHKRAIKKAEKNGLYVKEINTINDVNKFSQVYNKLYLKRKIPKPFHNTNKVFGHIFEYFKKYNKGMYMGVFTKEGLLIGGLCLGFENKSVIYLYGASDADIQNLPVLHLGFYHSFIVAKEKGFVNFDMGGYNDNVKENTQVYNINIFKYRFSKNIVRFPQYLRKTYNKPLYLMITFLNNLRHKFHL